MAELSLAFPHSECWKDLGEELVELSRVLSSCSLARDSATAQSSVRGGRAGKASWLRRMRFAVSLQVVSPPGHCLWFSSFSPEINLLAGNL